MRLLLVVAVVSLVGCGAFFSGPPEPTGPLAMSARVENDYAESLFTMAVTVSTPDGGSTTTQVFDEKRIGSSSSATAPFEARPGDVVEFAFSALSLGQRQSFGSVKMTESVVSSKKSLVVAYDFDLATAKFGIKYRWAP